MYSFQLLSNRVALIHLRDHEAKTRGFSLIELMVALVILGILGLMVTPLLQVSAQRAKEQELRQALLSIRKAIDAYKDASEQGRIAKPALGSHYPPNLDVLVNGVRDIKSPDSRLIYFLRRLPRDPMHPDPHALSAQTWGLRSYNSPPDAPAEGDDVFDVFSMSTHSGLNGVPYREW